MDLDLDSLLNQIENQFIQLKISKGIDTIPDLRGAFPFSPKIIKTNITNPDYSPQIVSPMKKNSEKIRLVRKASLVELAIERQVPPSIHEKNIDMVKQIERLKYDAKMDYFQVHSRQHSCSFKNIFVNKPNDCEIKNSYDLEMGAIQHPYFKNYKIQLKKFIKQNYSRILRHQHLLQASNNLHQKV